MGKIITCILIMLIFAGKGICASSYNENAKLLFEEYLEASDNYGPSPYFLGEIDFKQFKNEHTSRNILINDVLAIRFDQKGEKFTIDGLKEVFNELIRIPNLIQLLNENKGISFVQDGKADEKTISANKRKMAEIYPLTLEKSRNYKKYILNEIITFYPNSAYGNYAKAKLMDYEADKNMDKQLELYSSALKSAPNLEEAYLEQASIYINKKNIDTAAAVLKKVLKINSDNYEANFMLGNIYFNKNNYDGAMKCFTKTINIKPDFVQAYIFRSAIFSKQGNGKKEIKDLKTAVDYGNDYALRRLRELGIVYFTQKNKQNEANAGRSAAGYYNLSDIKNIAITDFEARGVAASDAATIADFVRGDMVSAGTYNVMERKNMEMVLAEQKFQLTGCTDQNCAVKMGKLLNVQAMVVGSVSKLMGVYIIAVNVVSVETGKILASIDKKATTIDELRDVCKSIAKELSR
jgi:tetratricopeptide (TPR) repeat protein